MKNSIDNYFKDDVKNHVLTVNLDSGLYRDITVHTPGSINAHYNITTRPDYLMFTGDMGCFVFQRTADMFGFFRGGLNPSYWSSKLEGVCLRNGHKEFDYEAVQTNLRNYLKEFLENCLDPENAEEAEAAIESFINSTEESETEYIHGINSWDKDEAGGLDLEEFWEYSHEKFTFHYQWACRAIAHAIDLYDAYKAEQQEAVK